MTGQGQTPIDPPPALLGALRKILRPLVRTLIERGVSYPYFADFVKSIFVEVAESDFPVREKAPTLSRVSLLTGIHRREVKRVREEGPFDEAEIPTAITLGAQIIARWTGEEPWIDESGAPKPLVRQSEGEGVPSFDGLVRSVSVDIHPRSVLDEWVRLGVAEIDEEGCISLRSSAFVPSRGFEEKAYYVGRNLRDHVSAALANLNEGESPHLERSVHYSAIAEGDLPELEALARTAGQEALVRVNERARVLAEGVSDKDTARRFNFGVYFFDEVARESSGSPDEEPDA